MNIFGQIIGFIAIGAAFIIFQAKDRKCILFWKLIADLLWIAHFAVLGLYTAMATTGISVFRELVFMNRDKSKILHSKVWIFIFILLYALATVFTWKNFTGIFAAFASSIATLGFWSKNLVTIRILSLIVSCLMLTYGIVNGSYATMLNEMITITSIMFFFWRKSHIKKRLNATIV